MRPRFLITILTVVHITTVTHAQPIIGPGKAVNPYRFSSKKSAIVTGNAVVSAHPLASQVGLAMMKKGGNAFDAAIATQMVLAVVYPVAGNLGGGGFMVARTQKGKLLALDYREMAPAAAHRDMYLDSSGKAQTDWSQNGHLASGVPGSVAGMETMHQHAKLPWKELVQPAIDLAEYGFVLTEAEAGGLNGYQDEFSKYNTITPAFVKPNGWRTGDTLVQRDLAETLKRIRDRGAKGFYEGETADLIVAEMKRANGIITKEDLMAYRAKPRTPLVFPYKKDHTIISMPPPSSGGILVNQMLKMLEDRKVAALGFQSAQYVQLVTEVERRAYADRAEHLGDADFYPVPLKTLTSKAYAQQRMLDYKAGVAGKSEHIKAGVAKESDQTTHLSVIDAAGNMVAVTTTLNGGYGSKTVVGGAGFLLNNEMDDFSVKPGVPNLYGAVGGEANAIVPGKRMLSSMTPTLILKNNKPYVVCGTPGGTTIITSVLQTVLNILEFNMSAADAVNKPKFHHQWLPDAVFVEKDFNPAVVTQLKAMGYEVKTRNAIGRTEVIKVIGKNKIEIAADKRGDDSAEGY
jgi:gamma-glutamyltranspeptidase / glutathione hydrolase